MFDQVKKNSSPFIVAGIVSVLLSAWVPFQQYVINPDGICYLQSAKVFLTSGLKEAMLSCDQSKWPFYSILIASISFMTSLTLETSAYVLNGFFSLVSVLTFMGIIKRLGASTRVLWFSALTILIAHDFTSVREYIIRDHGYFAFYLLSFYFLLRFFKFQKQLDAFLWSLSIITATLFRVEGVLFFVFVPWISFFSSNPFKKCIKLFFQLQSFLIFIAIVGFIWIEANPQNVFLQNARFDFMYQHMLRGFSIMQHVWHERLIGLHQYVLPAAFDADLPVVLIGALLGWLLMNMISSLSFIYFLLILMVFWKRLIRWATEDVLVFTAYILINLAIIIGFSLEYSFLSKRYLLGFSLILMCFIPDALNHLCILWKKRRSQSLVLRCLIMVAFLMLIEMGIGGIFNFGHSKKYIFEAGQWIDQQTAPTAVIYSNDLQTLYYTHRFPSDIFVKYRLYHDTHFLKEHGLKEFDYLAIRINGKDPISIQDLLKQKPIKVFSNNRQDRIEIYQRGIQ